jgi:hydroxymethylbilane synthase
MKTVRIICRQSRLSLLQADIVKQRILAVQPCIEVTITGRSSRGDRELQVSLATLEGVDFFTEEIYEALEKGEADIAVHSMKDMSATHFFSHTAFAVVDRDDVRDIAIFNSNIENKIIQGESICIGTCSPRREEMAVSFLRKALPQLSQEINIETRSIRGNVESRLTQLHEGIYDGTILATAGLNRLLRSETDAKAINILLKDKKKVLLPLMECVPAPCQGAIVVEAHPSNTEAVALLKQINDHDLFEVSYKEKQEAFQYGTGCLQKFGVVTLYTQTGNVVYVAGEDTRGNVFQKWQGLPNVEIEDEHLFSSTNHMKDFFEYTWSNKETAIQQPVIFVANYKAVQSNPSRRTTKPSVLQGKTIIASGTKTWLQLAKQGVWVSASADGLGFQFLLPALKMPIMNIQSADICVLTHEEAAERWRQKGYSAISTYELIPTNNKGIIQSISASDFIFWSSYSQYNAYKQYAKPTATHICAGGETATLLKQDGLSPIIFPTIKAFEQWRQISTRSLSVG